MRIKRLSMLFLATCLVLAFASTAPAIPIPITNPSFEDPVLAPGAFVDGVMPFWGMVPEPGGLAGTWNPVPPEIYPNQSGSNVALVQNTTALGQWSGESVTDGITYTLAVDAAGRIDYTTGETFQLRFVAGDPLNLLDYIVLATSGTFTPTEGIFNLAQFAYAASASDGTHTLLGINLLAFGYPLEQGVAQVLFDNVRLDASPTAIPAVPEPNSLLLFGSGLAGIGLLARRFRKII